MKTHGHREGNITHWGLLAVGGLGEGQQGQGGWGGIAWGETPNMGEGVKANRTHCHVCTYATVLHALHMYPKT